MKVKITPTQWGVKVELDGVEVPELVNVRLNVNAGERPQLHLDVLPTQIEAEFDADVHVHIHPVQCPECKAELHDKRT